MAEFGRQFLAKEPPCLNIPSMETLYVQMTHLKALNVPLKSQVRGYNQVKTQDDHFPEVFPRLPPEGPCKGLVEGPALFAITFYKYSALPLGTLS